MTSSHFGKNLKSVRLEKDITQEVISLKTGMSQTAYSRIERNSEPPKPELVLKIARALKVSTSELTDPAYTAEAARYGMAYRSDKKKTFFLVVLPLVVVLLLVAIAVLPEWAYSFAERFCEGFGTSKAVSDYSKRIAGTLTVILVIYCGQRALRFLHQRSKT